MTASTHRSQSLRCIQINLRHSRAAALNLSQLLLDLNIDVALVQEPYAAPNPITSMIELKFIPPGYITAHNLHPASHAFGAAIIIKSSVKFKTLPLCPVNHYVGIIVQRNQSPNICFLSVYCRPSTIDIPYFFQCLFQSIPQLSLNNIVIGADANARNPLWNSSCVNESGKGIEGLLFAFKLNLANVSLSHLKHKPLSTSFVDLTLSGKNISITDWIYPSIPSLSDHPIITFSVSLTGHRDKHPNHHPSKLPPPARCNLELLKSTIPSMISQLPLPSSIFSFAHTYELDQFLKLLVATIKKAIERCKLSFDPSSVPGKMPWWTKDLWGLRHKLRTAFKLYTKHSSEENLAVYKNLKSSYQKLIRKTKTEHWKAFCSTAICSTSSKHWLLHLQRILTAFHRPLRLAILSILIQSPFFEPSAVIFASKILSIYRYTIPC